MACPSRCKVKAQRQSPFDFFFNAKSNKTVGDGGGFEGENPLAEPSSNAVQVGSVKQPPAARANQANVEAQLDAKFVTWPYNLYRLSSWFL